MKGQLNLLDFISDPIYESHCLVALQRDKLVIAFRGSSCWKHLLSNFDFFKQLLPDLNNTVISQERFLGVHKGFWRAYAGLRDRIIQRVGNYIQSLGGQKPLLFVTGHSLGGALATFAAYDLTLQFQLGDLQMYNFGSPRVGNFLFALDYNAVVPNSFRIVFDGDLVVGLPQSFLFFQHVGTEIVVDRFGNVIINPTIVEKWLRTKSTAYSHAHRCSSYVEATTNSLKMLLDFVGLDFYCGSDLQALMPFVYFTNDELLAIFNLSSDWLKEEEIIEDVVSTPQQPRDSEFRPCKINSKVDLQTIEISKKNSEENNSNSSEDNLNELQKFLEF
ncbi:uncharacterized protein LOC135145420 [Zophobas morio]|uniref:uncharacterized protein LOC135145420 n=1 Tax=Zophobas morio TaxID=2755281 RepID=UPI003083DE44